MQSRRSTCETDKAGTPRASARACTHMSLPTLATSARRRRLFALGEVALGVATHLWLGGAFDELALFVLARRGKRRGGGRDQAECGQSENQLFHCLSPSALGAETIGAAARTAQPQNLQKRRRREPTPALSGHSS